MKNDLLKLMGIEVIEDSAEAFTDTEENDNRYLGMAVLGAFTISFVSFALFAFYIENFLTAVIGSSFATMIAVVLNFLATDESNLRRAKSIAAVFLLCLLITLSICFLIKKLPGTTIQIFIPKEPFDMRMPKSIEI